MLNMFKVQGLNWCLVRNNFSSFHTMKSTQNIKPNTIFDKIWNRLEIWIFNQIVAVWCYKKKKIQWNFWIHNELTHLTTYVQCTICPMHSAYQYFHHLDFIRIYFTCKKKIREIHSLEKFWIMNLIWICETNVER